MSYDETILSEGEKYGWGMLLTAKNEFDSFINNLLSRFGRIRLLEIGAWKRMLAAYIKEKFGDRVEYVGVDVIDPGKAVDIDAEFHIMAPTYLLFKPDSFHAVVMIEVLEHIFDYVAALREAYRVLVNGGGLFIQSILCTIEGAIIDETHVHVLHPVTLSRLVRYIGFKDVRHKIVGGALVVEAYK